jgi:flagellar hook-associated protein 3 FlgL
MMTSNLGDMAQAKMLRRETATVKDDLNRLTQELSSGRSSNLQKTLGGQFTSLAGLERSLELNSVFRSSNASAAQFADGQQIAMEAVQDTLVPAGPEFLKVASTGEKTQLAITVKNAERQLEQVVSALNGRSGAQSLFAGATTESPALASAEEILTAFAAALTGLTSPNDVLAAADAWFDTPGGGFETVAYLGSNTPLSGFDISEGQRETLSLTAADPAIRNALKGLATAALMDRGILTDDLPGQRAVLKSVGESLVTTTDQVTALRADIGFAQQRIDATRVRSEAEIAGLQQARDLLVGVDPYETALRLQEVQTQLETIYAITARMSRLSLASVLR